MEYYMIHSLVLMNKYPIHKNLSTSFVNLSALVRHLRSLQFVGRIQLELSSYEAEIELMEGNVIKAREQDHIAGRLSFGEDALQRIMIRAKEPGGLIHVYKEEDPTNDEGVYVDRSIAADALKMVAGPADKPAADVNKQIEDLFAGGSIIGSDAPIPRPNNVFEEETPQHWTELLALISELIKTIDESLTKGNFDFSEAFRNACGFVSFEFPFLDPETDVFSYQDGFISVRKRLSSNEMISGITAALTRIMIRLREDPYFGNAYHLTMHRLRVLANRRKMQFDTFGLSRELQKIIGI